MDNKILVAVVLAVVLIAGAFVYLNLNQTNSTSGQVIKDVKKFSIIANKAEFIPNRIEVNRGDLVRIYLTSEDADYGFSLPIFGVDENVPSGQTKMIEFVASRSGSYYFSCNRFCQGVPNTMQGTIVVN